jgi:hypothetical protein
VLLQLEIWNGCWDLSAGIKQKLHLTNCGCMIISMICNLYGLWQSIIKCPLAIRCCYKLMGGRVNLFDVYLLIMILSPGMFHERFGAIEKDATFTPRGPTNASTFSSRMFPLWLWLLCLWSQCWAHGRDSQIWKDRGPCIKTQISLPSNKYLLIRKQICRLVFLRSLGRFASYS